MAKGDPSPRVRLSLASALQRLPLEARWAIGEGLMGRPEDAGDVPLVLMTWYGIEPLAAADPERAAGWVERAAAPKLRRFLARRLLAVDLAQGMAQLLPRIEKTDDAARADVLAGMRDALRGRNQTPAPEGWAGLFERLAANGDATVREQAALLGVLFDHAESIDALRTTAGSADADLATRRRALEALTERRVAGLEPALLRLLDDEGMRSAAIRGLGAYEDPAIARALIERYPRLGDPERDEAVATLATRPAWARALLDAVGAGVVPRRDISATVARQILAFRDDELAQLLESAWGRLRNTAADKVELMAKYRAALNDGGGRAPDAARGRQVYSKTCLQCHKMFGEGGDVGPELTGSDRANVDYILENVLDPAATVGRDFQLTTIATTDGRLLNGIIRAQDEAAITVQTANDRLILPRESIEEMSVSDDSMMPEGLLEPLSMEEIRDLFAYLASPGRVEGTEK
jgi:putative heme-binding domain-containing protein